MRSLTSAVVAVAFTLSVGSAPAQAASSDDACSLLSQAEVGAAADAPVGAGQHTTPTYTRTCTWVADGIIVTLDLESVAQFEAAHGAKFGTIAAVGGMGDSAFVRTLGGMVAVFAKKGAVTFKLSVYRQGPADRNEAMEKSLAGKVVARL